MPFSFLMAKVYPRINVLSPFANNNLHPTSALIMIDLNSNWISLQCHILTASQIQFATSSILLLPSRRTPAKHPGDSREVRVLTLACHSVLCQVLTHFHKLSNCCYLVLLFLLLLLLTGDDYLVTSSRISDSICCVLFS